MVLGTLGHESKNYPLQNYITNTVSGAQGWVIREDTEFYIVQLWFGETRNYNDALYGAITTFNEPIKNAWIYLMFNNDEIFDIGCITTNGVTEA